MNKFVGRPGQAALSPRKHEKYLIKKNYEQSQNARELEKKQSRGQFSGQGIKKHNHGRFFQANGRVNHALDDDISTDSDSGDERNEREQILTIETGPCGELGDIGFTLYGGRVDLNDPDVDPDDPGIYIEEVTPGHCVEKTLESGDQLLKVDNVSVLDVPLHVAYNLIRAANERAVINVLKHPDNKMGPQIPEDSDDSGPDIEEEETGELGELDEIYSTVSKFSKVSKASTATMVMVDETDDGEEIEVDFMSGRPGHLDDLDFEFAGGKDQPFVPKNGGIFITKVKLGSILEEKMNVGDKIIKLEGIDITNVPHFAVINLIRASHGKATMTIRKANKQQVNKSMFTEGDDVDVCVNALGAKDEMLVEIKTGPRGRRGPIGFKITGGRDKPCVPGDPGVFIKAVKPGSKIEKILRPGDKILKVDGVNVTSATQGRVMDLIKLAHKRVLLHIKKANHDQERRKTQTVSQKFDAQQLEEYANAFEFYGKGKDHKVEISALPNLCRALGFNFTAQDFEFMVTEHDNGTGRITFPEFLQMITDISTYQQKDADILEAFQIFDPDANGYFPVKDLTVAFEKMPGYSAISEEEMEAILKIADSNNDGKVYYQERVHSIPGESNDNADHVGVPRVTREANEECFVSDFKDLVLPVFHKY